MVKNTLFFFSLYKLFMFLMSSMLYAYTFQILNNINAIHPRETPTYCRIVYFSLNISLAIINDITIPIPVLIGAANDIGTRVYTNKAKKFVAPFATPPAAA